MNLPIDKNSRVLQVARFGKGANFEAGTLPEEITGIVRIKNTGDGEAVLRYASLPDDEGVVLSSGETEYFYIDPRLGALEVLEGSINVMY